MVLDSEQQRSFLLQMMQAAHIPGAALDMAYATRAAIANALVADEPAAVSAAPAPQRYTPEELAEASTVRVPRV